MQFLTTAPNFRGRGQLTPLTRPSTAPVFCLHGKVTLYPELISLVKFSDSDSYERRNTEKPCKKSPDFTHIQHIIFHFHQLQAPKLWARMLQHPLAHPLIRHWCRNEKCVQMHLVIHAQSFTKHWLV